MMSVVVRDQASGQVYVFAKGADEQIKSILSEEEVQGELWNKIESEVYQFGAKGLRTLVFAMR